MDKKIGWLSMMLCLIFLGAGCLSNSEFSGGVSSESQIPPQVGTSTSGGLRLEIPSAPSSIDDEATATPSTDHSYDALVEKVKNSPRLQLVSQYDSGTANVTLSWEIANDALEPGSQNALVFVIETETYTLDGVKRLKEPINDFTILRDLDFDGEPDDYWIGEFGTDLKFKPLKDDPEARAAYSVLWNFNIERFWEHFK